MMDETMTGTNEEAGLSFGTDDSEPLGQTPGNTPGAEPPAKFVSRGVDVFYGA